jgi:hypothetical protein
MLVTKPCRECGESVRVHPGVREPLCGTCEAVSLAPSPVEAIEALQARESYRDPLSSVRVAQNVLS